MCHSPHPTWTMWDNYTETPSTTDTGRVAGTVSGKWLSGSRKTFMGSQGWFPVRHRSLYWPNVSTPSVCLFLREFQQERLCSPLNYVFIGPKEGRNPFVVASPKRVRGTPTEPRLGATSGVTTYEWLLSSGHGKVRHRKRVRRWVWKTPVASHVITCM